MARGKIVRHIQFKTGTQKRPATASISWALVEKPSGCVIWIKLGPDLDMGPYFWFGGAPGEPLTSITQYPNSKRVTANSQGVRPIRKNHFDVPGAAFMRRDTLEEILHNLFGDLTPTVVESADGQAPEVERDDR